MSGPADRCRRWLLAGIAGCCLASGAAAGEARPASPDAVHISEAVTELRKDPNLGQERQVRTLRWRDREQAAEERPGWLAWFATFFQWLAESARLVVWVLVAVLAGMLGAFLWRLLRARRSEADLVSMLTPTHVRDLDIRPESLPADIGQAARALWDSGQPRRALALLYRGLLSRLVHVHGAPVRESTTEGDCIGLAGKHLREGAAAYATGLVRTWQSAVYGAHMPEAIQVHALCDGFAAALEPAPPAGDGTA